MLGNYYYLIQPKSALLKAIRAQGDPELLPFLSEPALWTRAESGLVNPDYFTDAKILYQCYIYDLHVDDPIYQEIFGHLPISEKTFNKFWTMHRFEVDEHFEEVLEDVSEAALERIRLPGGSEIRRYYDALLRRRREGIGE